MGGTGKRHLAGTGLDRLSEPECPRKFQAVLVDVFQSGNAEYALSLQPGSQLELQVAGDEDAVALMHEGRQIGYLPPQHRIVAECIRAGWKYTASVIQVTGDERVPRVEVLVVGTPG